MKNPQFLFITDQFTLTQSSDYIDSFFSLYEQAFPVSDERENRDLICGRIEKGPLEKYSPITSILLIPAEKEHNVIAGLIIEYYQECQCLLLTYIVVDPIYRRKGIFKNLIREGIPQLIERNKWKIRAAFFESNIPWKTDLDSFDPFERYIVFHKLGAKWINLPYVQPSLGLGKDRVRNLYFFIFPELSGLTNMIDASVIMDFLYIFYRELGVENPTNDNDFNNIINTVKKMTINGQFQLQEIPCKEPESFAFPKASVGFHIAENDIVFTENKECPFFTSYEFDLFSYRNQVNPPYKSFCITGDSPKEISIIFPEYTTFISEGRFENEYAHRKELKVLVHINKTIIHEKFCIWTLVFSPANGDFFYQNEIIKISGLFCITQERTHIKDNIRFMYNGVKSKSPIDLLKALNNSNNGNFELLRSGFIQIDYDNFISENAELKEWMGKSVNFISELKNQNNDAYNLLEKNYKGNEHVEKILNYFAGCVLAIFDYQRMEIEEIEDTLTPFSSSIDSFNIINKGLITSISKNDRSYINVLNSIGACPYILLSSVVLAFNDYIALLNEKKLDETLSSSNSGKNINHFLEVKSKIENSINNDILPNVFNYSTERDCFEIGMKHRGTYDIIVKIRNRIMELNSIIEWKDNQRKSTFDIIVSFLLATISLIQLEEIFRIISNEINSKGLEKAWDDNYKAWIFFISFFILVISIFIFFARRIRKKY